MRSFERRRAAADAAEHAANQPGRDEADVDADLADIGGRLRPAGRRARPSSRYCPDRESAAAGARSAPSSRAAINTAPRRRPSSSGIRFGLCNALRRLWTSEVIKTGLAGTAQSGHGRARPSSPRPVRSGPARRSANPPNRPVQGSLQHAAVLAPSGDFSSPASYLHVKTAGPVSTRQPAAEANRNDDATSPDPEFPAPLSRH